MDVTGGEKRFNHFRKAALSAAATPSSVAATGPCRRPALAHHRLRASQRRRRRAHSFALQRHTALAALQQGAEPTIVGPTA